MRGIREAVTVWQNEVVDPDCDSSHIKNLYASRLTPIQWMIHISEKRQQRIGTYYGSFIKNWWAISEGSWASSSTLSFLISHGLITISSLVHLFFVVMGHGKEKIKVKRTVTARRSAYARIFLSFPVSRILTSLYIRDAGTGNRRKRRDKDLMRWKSTENKRRGPKVTECESRSDRSLIAFGLLFLISLRSAYSPIARRRRNDLVQDLDTQESETYQRLLSWESRILRNAATKWMVSDHAAFPFFLFWLSQHTSTSLTTCVWTVS